MKRIAHLLIGILALTLAAPLAMADGMIVPIRPDHHVMGHWAVKYHHVNITVREQVAEVSVDQEFVNTGSGMIEVEYMFPVPPEAAIDSMTLIVNGKEYAAQLYKADEARKIYEDIVRTKKDPALLEYVGYGLYRTKAFPLEAGKPAHVVVTYKTLCKKDRNLVEVFYPLNTEKFSAKAIDDVSVKVDIKSKFDITNVYSPSHDIKTERKDSRQVIATYEAKNTIPSTDFQVFYTAADDAIGANLITHQGDPKKDGFFMMLATPNIRLSKASIAPKDVVLVMDHSGSMAGQKIDQVKESVGYILKNLNKDDRFSVVMFNDSVEKLSDGLLDASKKNVEATLGRLDHVDATGGTNIDEALTTALNMWGNLRHMDDGDRHPDKDRPKYVIFMTDGLPTVGKTTEKDILGDTKHANDCNARIFAFGVGYDVNVRLLDKLVGDNGGKSDYVKPKEPIETKISSLYAKIKNPVMTDVKMEIKGVRTRDTYPRQIGDLFEGDQLVVTGRYYREDVDKLERSKEHDDTFTTQLIISGVYEGKQKTFEYVVNVAPHYRDSSYNFVEKLWAMRRVGWLLDQIQFHGENKEVIDELVSLSKEYGIMTPYTSFLADERTVLRDREALSKSAGEFTGGLSRHEGADGQVAAMNRQALNEAKSIAAPAAAGPGGRGAAYQIGYDDKDSYEAGKEKALESVRQVGNQALYRRGQVWIASNASTLDPEKDKDKIQTVDRYSDEYFKIVRANSAEENQVLSQQKTDEHLLITLRGQAYLIR